LGEFGLDPGVAAAADLSVVEVRLGRVDGDDGDAVLAENRIPGAEELLEMDVADVSRVVVPGHDNECLATETIQVALGLRVLLLEPERRQVARADHDVRVERVDVRDRPLHQIRDEIGAAAVEIGQMRDRERLHARSLEKRPGGYPTSLVPWL